MESGARRKGGTAEPAEPAEPAELAEPAEPAEPAERRSCASSILHML